jgi:hypothetical protein
MMSGTSGTNYVARFAGLGFGGSRYPQLALWVTGISSASPTLLLDLLQNPTRMIAGDEGDAFVGLQLVQ